MEGAWAVPAQMWATDREHAVGLADFDGRSVRRLPQSIEVIAEQVRAHLRRQIPAQMWRVPAQMWKVRATTGRRSMWEGEPDPSRRRCCRGEPSQGADVGGVSPVPVQMWEG